MLNGMTMDLQEATGQLAMIEDMPRYPDWRVQVANTPAVITSV
jgi:hypothetical protein